VLPPATTCCDASPVLASHLGHRRHGQRSVGILHEASQQGIDLGPALPVLRELARDSDDPWEREQAAYALTRDAVRREDWDEVRALLRGTRHTAGACARTLSEMDVDPSPASDDLRALLTSPDAYDRSMAERALERHEGSSPP